MKQKLQLSELKRTILQLDDLYFRDSYSENSHKAFVW